MHQVVAWCDSHSLGNQLLFTPSASSYEPQLDHRHCRTVRIPDLPPPCDVIDPAAPGWIPCVYSPSHSPDSKTPLLVIHFHGTGGDAWKSGRVWFDVTKRLSELEQKQQCHGTDRQHNPSDVAVLSVEYPGYGVYDGRPSDVVCRRIATAVLRYVLLDLRVPPSQIVLCGRSMGSGVACYASCVLTYRDLIAAGGVHDATAAAAAECVATPAAMDAPIAFRTVVLISPFTCMHGVLEGFPLGKPVLQRLIRNRFLNGAAITRLAPSTRLVVVHGTRDTLISWKQGDQLVALATQCADRKLVLDEQGDHHNMPRLHDALSDVLLSPGICAGEQLGWRPLRFDALEPQHCHRIVSSYRLQRRRLRLMRLVGVLLAVGAHWRCNMRLRWVALLWSCALFGLGLTHRSMGSAMQQQGGPGSNKVVGMSPKVRFALITIVCRCVLPALALRAGGPATALLGSVVTHMLLR